MFDLVLVTAVVCVVVLSCACVGWWLVDRRAEQRRRAFMLRQIEKYGGLGPDWDR